jgi:DNA polymerase III delta subunit
MIYLFLGDEGLLKDQAIAKIKQTSFTSDEALRFDYETLHGNKLDADDLKKALMALPAIVSKRLIVLRQVEKLNAKAQEIVFEFIQRKYDHADVVLDSQDREAESTFLKKITPFVKIQRFSKGVRQNVFDMTNAIAAKNGTDALKILDDILEEGDNPLQILGAMVWFWGKQRTRLSTQKFKKGLLMLQEADINIKRSRLKPEQSLELLVVKLSSLTV